MTKLSITLLDDNGDKVTYNQDKVPGKRVLDFWDIQEKLENTEYTPKAYLMDRLDFVALLFDAEAVTAEAILNGVNAWELEKTVDDLILTAVGIKNEEDPKLMDSLLEKDEIAS